MNKEYCEAKRNELYNKFANAKNDIIRNISESDIFKNMDKKYLIQRVRELGFDECDERSWKSIIEGIHGINYPDDIFDFYFYSLDKFVNDTLGFGKLFSVCNRLSSVKDIEDSDWVDFDGDVVITDPCYTTDEWGDGFNFYAPPLFRDTIYGDWSCTTYETETNKELGDFCADSGMVCVDTLENILVRKPTFLEEIPEWCRTIIPNFKGKVKFEIVCTNKEDDEKEFSLFNYEVRVVGDGCNKSTGKAYNFYTTQTGL